MRSEIRHPSNATGCATTSFEAKIALRRLTLLAADSRAMVGALRALTWIRLQQKPAR